MTPQFKQAIANLIYHASRCSCDNLGYLHYIDKFYIDEVERYYRDEVDRKGFSLQDAKDILGYK